MPSWGLSPLARGNRPKCLERRLLHGPIPARAGEPPKPWLRFIWARAYPRSRGGTWATSTPSLPRSGLSPLARGNPSICTRQVPWSGPIPARAGEPGHAFAQGAQSGAYPRSRGGTFSVAVLSMRSRGLSPLARGNLVLMASDHRGAGPIPARAGEPRCFCPYYANSRAYPRSRGGTGRRSCFR